MNTLNTLTISGLLALLLAGPAHAQAITEADYELQQDHLAKTHDADKAKCKNLMGNQRDVCKAEADAKEDVAQADLKAAYKNTAKERLAAAKVLAKADFDVAKERCDDQKGDAKSFCVSQAKAERDRALADVEAKQDTHEARKKISAAKQEAGEENIDATFAAEIKKCDSLAGDAKDTCQAHVKQRFHKEDLDLHF